MSRSYVFMMEYRLPLVPVTATPLPLPDEEMVAQDCLSRAQREVTEPRRMTPASRRSKHSRSMLWSYKNNSLLDTKLIRSPKIEIEGEFSDVHKALFNLQTFSPHRLPPTPLREVEEEEVQLP